MLPHTPQHMLPHTTCCLQRVPLPSPISFMQATQHAASTQQTSLGDSGGAWFSPDSPKPSHGNMDSLSPLRPSSPLPEHSPHAPVEPDPLDGEAWDPQVPEPEGDEPALTLPAVEVPDVPTPSPREECRRLFMARFKQRNRPLVVGTEGIEFVEFSYNEVAHVCAVRRLRFG